MKEPRVLVIGDIHGGYKALLQVLERAEVSSKDTLIFLGDFVDGWSESPKVIDHLIQLKQTNTCVFIRGNHDALALDWLKHEKSNPVWLFHGGQATLDAYKKETPAVIKKHVEFIEGLDDYFLDKESRLFLHAGFTNIRGIEHEYFKEMFYWDRSLWEMALCLNPKLSTEDPLYPDRLKLYHEIYIGHTPTVRFGKTVPMHAVNVWNMDTGAAFKGPLTIMDIHTKEFWQSDRLDELYYNEMGRN
jgi:serine/threonine protein phosphatase 1